MSLTNAVHKTATTVYENPVDFVPTAQKNVSAIMCASGRNASHSEIK